MQPRGTDAKFSASSSHILKTRLLRNNPAKLGNNQLTNRDKNYTDLDHIRKQASRIKAKGKSSEQAGGLYETKSNKFFPEVGVRAHLQPDALRVYDTYDLTEAREIEKQTNQLKNKFN